MVLAISTGWYDRLHIRQNNCICSISSVGDIVMASLWSWRLIVMTLTTNLLLLSVSLVQHYHHYVQYSPYELAVPQQEFQFASKNVSAPLLHEDMNLSWMIRKSDMVEYPPECEHLSEKMLELRSQINGQEGEQIVPFKRLLLDTNSSGERNHSVYDVFIFNNELDMLEMRLMELWNVVDVFVLVESCFSQSGAPKPLYFEEAKNSRFSRYLSKIVHVKYDNNQQPPPGGGETSQRALAMPVLRDLPLDTLIMLSDVDEIPLCSSVFLLSRCAAELPRDMYGILEMPLHYYSFHWRRKQSSRQTTLRDSCTSKMFFRSYLDTGLSLDRLVFAHHSADPPHWIFGDAGLHCSYCMPVDRISKKLQAFAHREYSGEPYTRLDWIEDHVRSGRDLFDRADVQFDFWNSTDGLPYAVRSGGATGNFSQLFFPPSL